MSYSDKLEEARELFAHDIYASELTGAVIDEIGEEKYIESLGALTWEEERKICDCILAGLEYGNGKHQSQKLEDAFPKITALFSNPKKTNNK